LRKFAEFTRKIGGNFRSPLVRSNEDDWFYWQPVTLAM